MFSFRNKIQLSDHVPNPRPLKHFDVQTDEEGNVKFIESPNVAPSLASDFQVSVNALYGRSSNSAIRVSTDPVDIDERAASLLNFDE